ncbi:hypothetical protein AZSI13_32300 [Azospira sp. I13]|uniref:hypothetical protein n=1 Tax=Azospira sp. I13 TaxID=1765050 RepID=UPI000D42159D|nr:hypothetical protein [Azospira sp. I13]GBG03903.1 hypothetical protein AZSI13_32300 [Azospira sp. I13]
MALADVQALVADLVRDDGDRISPEERDRAVTLAVARYSADRPRTAVQDVVAQGGSMLPLPPAWEPDISLLTAVEVPVGQVPPAYLPARSFWLYAAPGGLSIMLATSQPQGRQVRLSFLASHVLSDVEDTIPTLHREAVAAWAGSILLEQLANLHTNDGDSTIQADSVDRRSKGEQYAARARAAVKRYRELIGVADKPEQLPAGVQITWGPARPFVMPRRRL